MLQEHLLRRFAPHSLHLVYNPHDSGNPGHDISEHISRFSHRRIDLESTQLVGGRVIGRVEFDLGAANESEMQHRILTIAYALNQLESIDNAAEFVRIIKEGVSTGVEADPRSLQIWASWAYTEIRNRTKSGRPKDEVITEVLKELAMLAMQLTAVTATKEERLAEEPNVVEFYGSQHYSDELDPTERRRLFENRCYEILDHKDTATPFTAELRAICSKLPRSHSSGSVYDEETQFHEYLADRVNNGNCDGEALQESHERVTEQYDEGGVVSFHMGDTEKFIVEGTLDEDVDASYLPSELRFLADEVKELFLEGVPMYSNSPDVDTIDSYIEFRLNQAFGDPSDKQFRSPRTIRMITSTPDRGLVEYQSRITTYSNREERQYVREVLEQIVDNLRRDFVYNCMNRSKNFRTFMLRIQNALEVPELKQAIEDAYQARLKETISIKMFTALTTLYKARRWNLESNPMQETREVDGQARTFILYAATIALAREVKTKDLRQLSTALQSLPIQERQYIRGLFKRERPVPYGKIYDGLLNIVAEASHKKLLYLRFAFFENAKTGKANEPHNMIHLLTSEDKADIWRAVNEATKLPEPLAA
jgi:hypothetical protein